MMLAAWTSTRPAQASRTALKTGQEISACGASESICVRIATVPCAQAHCRPNSMRACTSSAVQRTERSLAVAVAAPRKLPSGLGERGQIWPLSRWVWMSTKPGQTRPPLRSTAPAGAVPSGAMLAMRPSLISMSKRTSPSKSGLPSGPLPTRQAWERASASQ